ncbi:proteasome subunit beta [Halomarina rubra]|uniref:Proteasome subunit beta n=1 Tax=Halomarina rubra TaxID=2071873 RepID=A0ABD6ATB8_9EURY|nr:proteasome subunit beta [Halomarina rubra]
MDKVLKTGTTTVALKATDGVVLAADRRASLGGRFVANKNAIKIEPVHDRAAVTISGSVGGGQAFVRQLRVQSDLYETRRDREMSMDALAQTAANVIRGMQAQPLLGGVDVDGTPRVFQIDGAGGVIEDDYTASGSGMTVATGALERLYDPEMSVEEAVDVAAEAIAAASERDTASGNGITVTRITADGVQQDTYDDTTEVLA